MAQRNPFPDYPIIRFQQDPGQVQEITIATDPIVTARALVHRYVKQWMPGFDSKERREPMIIAVKGDFGSGKTHLLLDSVALLQQELTQIFFEHAILRVSAMETDPLTWFRSAIGPELVRLPLRTVTIELYAQAGRTVAAGARLTVGAVDKLVKQPDSIHSLIRENLLNVTAVDQEFTSLLSDVCPDVSEQVRTALAGLLWGETEQLAINWLAGRKLSQQELDQLQLRENMSSPDEAGDVLSAVAAIYAHNNQPFVLIIDELEQLTRYDKARASMANITWLKRLLESLAQHNSMVMIAGQLMAWQAPSDYLDRFSRLKPIELNRLAGKDVLNLVRARIKRSSMVGINPDMAETVATVCHGNMRRVLSLCRALFDETDGFRKDMDAQFILSVAEAIGQRVSAQEALSHIHELLDQKGLQVQSEMRLLGAAHFDLVGLRLGIPVIIVECKHAVTQEDYIYETRRFLLQMQAISKDNPNVLGLYVADGSVDQDALLALSSNQTSPVRWFDLSQRDVLKVIAEEIEKHLASTSENTARLAELTERNAQLLQEIELAQDAQKQFDLLRLEREQMLRYINELTAQQAILSEQNDRSTALEDRVQQTMYLLEDLRAQNRQLANQIALTQDSQEKLEYLERERAALLAQMQRLTDELAQRDGRTTRLEELLIDLERKRTAEATELYERLEYLSRRAGERRDMDILAPTTEESSRKMQATYTELVASYSLYRRIRLALTPRNGKTAERALTSSSRYLMSMRRLMPFVALLAIIVGVTAIVIGSTLSAYPLFGGSEITVQGRYSLIIVGILYTMIGVTFTWRQITEVDRFLEYRRTVLRDIYINSTDPMDLVQADRILRSTLEDIGPTEGRKLASTYLAKEFPYLKRSEQSMKLRSK